jgi:N-dimethylarginine dimethylaminohydrolase
MPVAQPVSVGCQTMTGTLRRVLVRPPQAADCSRWRAFGWRAAPDPVRIAAEHEAFCAELEGFGAEVILARAPLEDGLDSIYVNDPVFLADPGAILLRPGKKLRRGEPEAMARDLEAAAVPLAARLEEPGTAEGGDMVWLDARTLLVGRGYRTNGAGIEALARALPGVEVVAFDLPHYRGPGQVLHLMSFLSPLDADLALIYSPLAPVRLLELLAERGIALVEVPDEEYASLGCNVLALGPRVALALGGNPESRRRMERAGVDVRVYWGEELSRKGDGGPTCLTRPLVRALV